MTFPEPKRRVPWPNSLDESDFLQLSKDELIARYSGRLTNRKYVERAVDAVLEGRVKKHIFTPSGRVLFTVVGRSGDEFIDLDRPFCSCQHFFYRVLGGSGEVCYHLLSNSIAAEIHEFSETVFHDEELGSFMELLSSDLLSRSGDKEDKDNAEPSDTRPR